MVSTALRKGLFNMTLARGSVMTIMAVQPGQRSCKSPCATATAFSKLIRGVSPEAPHSGHRNSSCIVSDFI